MIFLDFETRSHADLKKVGATVYAEDPTTEVICLCWAVDDGPIYAWLPSMFSGTDSIPAGLVEAIEAGHDIEAHNVAFEFRIWHEVMVRRLGWPAVSIGRWRDTMALACYKAMPAALDRLCRALGLPGKDPGGARLITRYSKLHLASAKKIIPSDDLARFVAYCRQDVSQEREVKRILGELPDTEKTHFRHDFAAGERGLYLDQAGIEAAASVVDQRSEDLENEFRALTGFSPGQRDKVLAWLRGQGLDLPNMQAETLDEVLGEEADTDDPDGRKYPPLTPDVRRALELRRQHGRASTKKLDAMLRHRARNGRASFQFRYHGAVTGRTTGLGLQPLNLNRGIDGMEPDMLVRDIMRRDARWLDMVYGDAMDAVGKASRHFITADPAANTRIIAGDFASIEAIVLACLAGEHWKVDAFRQGVKIYEMMAEKIYSLPPGTVTKKTHPNERQDGKTGELAFGYQGALNAWRNFDSSTRHTDERIIEICRAWRRQHPATTSLWKGLEGAAVRAMGPGVGGCAYGKIGFEREGDWLTMVLPNDKRLWYYGPELRLSMPVWHDPEVNEDCAAGECDCRPSPRLTYMSQKAGQWKRVWTYGGKLTENAVQAISRELLKPAELRAEMAGYPVILSIYDEIVCEVPNWHGSVEEFKALMEQSPGAWADGWPVTAEVWEGPRYRK